MLRPFQATLHRRPPGAWQSEQQTIDSAAVQTLLVPVEKLVYPFSASFEEVAERLAAEPRLYFEPDGSFVWACGEPTQCAPGTSAAWQLDGVVYDRDGHVLYVELKGSCPAEALTTIARACGIGPEEGVLQLMRAAVTLELPDFAQAFCDP